MTELVFKQDIPSKPLAHLLLMHGAGAGCRSVFLELLTQALLDEQIAVYRFNFAYMTLCEAGAKRPPPALPKLVAELAEVLAALPSSQPIWLGGKSMGARVCSHYLAQRLPLENEQRQRQVQGAIAFGYPFCPKGKQVDRIAHFADLQKPILILQGERDSFGGSDYVSKHVAQPLENVMVTSLGAVCHDFMPLRTSGLSQQQVIRQAAYLTKAFMLSTQA